jgi:TP901 family phage tail tape measure protein
VAKAYAIETVFKLIDQVSAPTSKVGKALDSLGIKSKTVSNALKRDFDKAAARVDRLGKSLKRAAGYIAAAGAAAIGAGIAIATKQFIEFDAAVVEAGALFKDMVPSSETFQKSLKDIGTEARRVASITEYNAVDTAGAMQKMAMAGMTSAQSMALLEGTTNLATAAGTDLTTAVDIATDALGAFGMSATKENLGRISDVMAKTASSFNTGLTAMFETIKYAGPAFTGAGQSVDTLSAAIGVLANAGIKGSDAGTALNAIFTQLKTSAKQAELKELGISISDAEGNFLNLFDILSQFENKLAGMGDVQRGTILSSIFGVRGEKAVNLLLQTGTAQLKEYEVMLQDSARAAQQMADVMRGSIKNKIEVLKSALTEMGFKFVEAFQGKGVEAITRLTEAVGKFDVAPLVGIAAAAADGIGKFAGILMGAVKIAWQFRYVILAIATPIAAYHAALMAITIITGVYNKIMAVTRVIIGIVHGAQMAYAIVVQGNTAATAALAFVTKETSVATGIFSFILKTATRVQKAFMGKTIGQTLALAGQTAATAAATAAQWALNVAMNANPVGLIIMAVAALIVIIVLLVKNWEKVTTAIKTHANKIMAVLSILFGPIGFLISMIKEVASNWGKIKEALAAAGLFDKIKEIGAAIKDFIQPAIDGIVSAWNTVKEAVAGFFSYIINGIKSFLEPAITWIVNAWNTASSAIGGFFKGIFSSIYNFVKPALDWFGEKWLQIVSFFKDNAIVNAIKVIGGTLLSGLLAPIQGLLEILSYIPGLGHLAGKGAEKIEEFRNYLKGVDGATVSAEVNTPDEIALTPPTDTATLVIPGVAPLDFSDSAGAGTGAAGKSKLHGVVDISGGAIPSIPGDETTRTATSGGASPEGNVVPPALTQTVIGIAAVLRKIDASVSIIASSLPIAARAPLPEITATGTATRTSFALPQVRMNGDEEDASDYYNPRAIAPITQAERMVYRVDERINRLVIEVAAERGTAARIVRAPRDAEIELVNSGGNR